MKKVFLVLVSLVLIFSTTISSYAISSKPVQFDTSYLESFVATNEEEMLTSSEISESDMYAFRRELNTTNLTLSQKNNIILLTLGYTEEELEAIGQAEIDLFMANASEVSLKEEYIKVDQDGTKLPISKEQCEKEVLEIERSELGLSLQSILPPEGGGGSSTIDTNNTFNTADGYMRILTTMAYQVGLTEKGWYYVSGTYTWLKMPVVRIKDGISLSASNVVWPTDISDSYSTMTYKWNDSLARTGTVTEKKTTDRTIKENGLGYTYWLPQNTYNSSINYTYNINSIVLYLRGRIRINQPSIPTPVGVYSMYTHLTYYVGVDPQFSWSPGAGGLSASVGAGIYVNSTEYTSGCTTNYTAK